MSRRGKKEREGPLEGHYRTGRVYRPPLLAQPTDLTLSDWVRSDLPDLLWPVLLAAQRGNRGLASFGQLQRTVISVCGDALDESECDFDGRLTSLEEIPPPLRDIIVKDVTSLDEYRAAVPRGLADILRLYDDVPGAWLLLNDRSPALPPDEAATLLMRSMVDVVRDGHLNALVKAAPFGWLVMRGRVSMPPEQVEILKDYPIDPEKVGMGDAFIRSSFLAFKTFDSEEAQQRRAAWARSFWRQNWRNFDCWPEEAQEDGDAEQAPGAVDAESVGEAEDEDEGGDTLAQWAGEAIADAIEMTNDFLQHALDHDLEVDLFDAARHEVVCGLASRAARATLATLRAPHLWTGEHGMNTIRMLAETTIVLAWMRLQEPDIYARYQDYGRGKAKLVKAHLETLMEGGVGEYSEMVEKAAEGFGNKFGGEWGGEFQQVSVESTFAGVSLRQMALDADLGTLYRHVYQSASGVAHGEWWSIEDYAMQRCRNPLHLFHQVPSFDPDFPVTPEFSTLLVRSLEEVLVGAAESLGIDLFPEEPDADDPPPG